MNGDQQRQRHVAIQSAEKRIADIELVMEALAKEIVTYRDAAAKAVSDERTHRLKLADEQRAYVDGEARATLLRAAHARQEAMTSMTLWQRLRWLVRGAA